MSQLDEAEYARLADQVRDIERVLLSTEAGDVSVLLKSFLHNAKSRMEEIRYDEIRAVDEKKDSATKEAATAIQLAEMEHRLSASEQRQYAGFLKSEFFKKDDLEELEGFYAKSWDRLSERGKTEMSTRVWEGIKRRQFSFDELSEPVAEKETDRTYLQLTEKAQLVPNLPHFTPEAKDDFIEKYESGEKKAASKILSRVASAEYPTDHRSADAKSASALKKELEDQTPDSQAPRITENSKGLSLAGVVSMIDTDSVQIPEVGSSEASRVKGR